MKKSVLAACLALAAVSALGQTEGIAEFKSTMNTEAGKAVIGTSKIYLTKGAYRAESQIDYAPIVQGRKDSDKAAPTFRMTMIAKLSDPDKLYMIDDPGKTYSVMDLKKMREMGESQRKDAKDRETYTVQKLGRDTVAGLSCEKALLTSSTGSEIEVCMTRDIEATSQWISAMSRRQHDSISWMGALKDHAIEGFPIRLSVRSRGSKSGGMTFELSRFEKKSIPGSLFEVPAGYKLTDSALEGMGKALGKLTPEQRRELEEAMKKRGHTTPKP